MRLRNFLTACLLLVSVWCARAQTVTQLEYWVDDFFEYKTNQPINGIGTFNLQLPTIPGLRLPAGMHQLHFRLLDSQGRYSPVSSNWFMKMNHADENGTNALEYWFDDDRSNINETAGDAGQEYTILQLETKDLSAGFHRLNFRAKITNGVYSAISQYYIYKISQAGAVNVLEYWFDDDNASPKSTPVTLFDQFVPINIDTKGLSEGVHRITFRTGTANGVYSPPSTNYFMKGRYSRPDESEQYITEYVNWFDDDCENAEIMPLQTPVKEFTLTNIVMPNTLTGGEHTIHVSFGDNYGQWSDTVKRTFQNMTEKTINPKLGLTTATVKQGEPFEIKGKEFSPNSTVNLIFTLDAESFTANATTNSSGEFTYSYDNKSLGSGTISVYGKDEKTNKITPVRSFIVEKTVQDEATIKIIAPAASLSEKAWDFINISWRDVATKAKGNYLYPISDTGTRRFYSYTVEYQIGENGPWKMITQASGKAIFETSIGVNMTVLADIQYPPTDYFRIRVTDNYYPANTVISEVCKILPKNSNVNTSLQWDYSFPQKNDIIQPKGVAADGVARLFVRVVDEKKNIKSVSATLSDDQKHTQPNLLGKLCRASEIKYSLEANNATDISLSNLTPNLGDEVWFWYVAPDDFTDSPDTADPLLYMRTVQINIDISRNDGTTEKQVVDVGIVRPPLMMVHGLGGDEHTWDNFKYKINSIEETFINSPLFKQKKAVNLKPDAYFTTNALILLDALPIYDAEAPSGNNSFQDNINTIRAAGYASNQVDYVCHSMGGCVLRTAINQYDDKFYGRVAFVNDEYKSYDKGFVHKAITIDTPHNGSPIGDLVTEFMPFIPVWDDIISQYILKKVYTPYFKPVGTYNHIDHFEASDAVRNLQFQGSEGVRFSETKVKNHLIAGNVNFFSNSKDDYFSLVNSLTKALTNGYGADNMISDFIDVLDIAYPYLLMTGVDHKLEEAITSSTSGISEAAFRYLNSYSEEVGVPDFLKSSDVIVSLASQLALSEQKGQVIVSSNNSHIFQNSDSPFNANHLAICSRTDVGTYVLNLLNTSVNSSSFGDVIKANTNAGGSISWSDRVSLRKNANDISINDHFDKSHIEIIAPHADDNVNVNDNIEIIYHLKDTTNLIFVDYLFQDSHDIILNKNELQSFNLIVSPDYLGKQMLCVYAAYRNGDQVNRYIDTLSINVLPNVNLVGFRIDPYVANIYTDQRYYPQMTAIYETFLSKVPVSPDILSIRIQDPSVVGYDDLLRCFTGLKVGTTFAEITYENITDTLYFNVMDMPEDIITSIKEVYPNQSTHSSLDVSLYPNPVDKEFTLSVNNAEKEKIYVSIYNMNGQKIEDRVIFDNLAVFNISSYPKGIYFIRVMNESGKSVTEKLIKK